MVIQRKSRITGIDHERDIQISIEENARWEAGEPIEKVCPYLSVEDYDFIKNGVTPEESAKEKADWLAALDDLDEEEDDDQDKRYHR